MRRLLSLVLAHARKTIKHMWSRKTGPLCAIPLAMTAGKQIKSSPSIRLYINFFQPSSNWLPRNALATRPSNVMIQPRRLTSVFLNVKIFLWKPRRGLWICTSNSILLNFVVGLTRKPPNFGKFLGNISLWCNVTVIVTFYRDALRRNIKYHKVWV